MPDIQPHDLTAIPVGIGEFSFAEGATTVATAQAAGYDDFGNLQTFEVQQKGTTKEHKGSYRTGRRVDKTSVVDTTVGYLIKCDELTARKLRIMFYGTQGSNTTQTARTAVAADAITAPVIYKWYDIFYQGVRYRELTTVASAAGTENTDYIVDYKLGRIRAITATGFGALTITAPAILVTDATSLKPVTPQVKPRLTGMGRMVCFDTETGGLVFDHTDFGCEIYPDGNVSFDGEKEAVLSFRINITAPVGLVNHAK